MAKYFDVHPVNPQSRSIQQAVEILRGGGLVAYPTDSCYALGCTMGNSEGLDRIRAIRHLDKSHHFTLVVSNFAQLGEYVQMDNRVFRAVKAATPGAYTFILPATREVPKAMVHPKKRTVGVRVPDHVTTLALLDALGEPMMTSTLLMPGFDEPLTDGWQINEQLGHQVDGVIDSGDCGVEPTTVVNFTGDDVTIDRVGAGDPSPFA